MSGQNPEAILYDINGNPLAVQSGSATPASTPALMFGGSDGANTRYILVDGSGRTVAVGAGVAGTPAGGVISIQGVAGGTTVPISGTLTANIGTTNGLALDTSVNGILVAQNSTTSGQTGPLIQGAVTTAAPSYTTAKTSPLSLTTAGALRIDGSAVTQPISGTVTANAGSGNFAVVQATAANLNATVVGTVTANIGITNGLALDATLTGGTQTTRITDGTNTATVKAASTAAVATDKALVVAISPNNSVAVTGTVTSNIGTTGGLALDATLAKLTIAQGTTLGSNTQALIGGSVTTASPTYTTGQISPISLTTAGAIRVDGSGVTQPVSGTVAATQSGTWTVQPGNTANTTPWLTTISQGGNSASVSASNALKVDGSAVTQPVSGTVTANQGGAPWSQNVTQFGGVNISTGTGASGTGIPRVTVANDSNILATQSGTWTVAQGAPNSLANKWPVQVTDGTNTMPTADVASRAQFDKITDGTNTAAVKAASTAAVAADPALVVAISPNNTLNAGAVDVTGTGTLNALNATAQVAVQSESNAGMQLLAGTLIGTIVPEVSYDGATTWVAGFFDDPSTGNKVSSIVFGSSNTATTRTIVGVGGASHVRVRVSAFTSGTATCNVRASVFNRSSLLSEGAFTATIQPPDAIQIGGWDGSNLRVPAVKAPSTAPATTDQALVVVLSPNQLSIPVTTTPATSTPGIAVGYINTSAVTNVALRATTYTEQSANFTGSISSSSANDTSAGTGARTLKITFVDSTGATAGTESVTLNGTTAVNLVTTTKCFIEKIEVVTVGSTGSNVGTISLFTGAAGAGTLVGTIAATDNRTFWGHHYVVTGKTANITGMTGLNNNSSNNTVFTLHAQTLPVANQTDAQVSDWITGGLVNQTLRIYSSLIKVVGPARVTMFAAPGGTPNIKSQGSFDFYDA